MICRFLEKKIEVLKQEIPGNAGNDLELEYYLVECSNSEHQDDKEYGIQIVERAKGNTIESVMFRNVFSCRDSVSDLVKKLADLVVTPVTLPYILDDVLGA